MRRLAALSLLLSCSCKGQAAASPATPDALDDSHKNWEGSGQSGCQLKSETNCGSGRLPRITEKEWTPAMFEQMFRRSAEGTVAVDHATGSTQLVPGCRLDGSYTEAQGEPGSGRFWATDRVLFKAGDLGPECQTATHVVAAFVVRGLEGGKRAGDAGAISTISIHAPLRFSSILVPLPCPPTSDSAPAKGCMGRGFTGPQRKKRAVQIWHDTMEEAYKRDLTELFEVYVLMSDDRRGLEYLSKMHDQPRVDCFLGGQIFSAGTSTPRASWPRFYPSDATCEYQPPFLTCFPGFFEPSPGIRSCWRPAVP